MVIIELPIDHYIDKPHTHPVLDIGSSSCCLLLEVQDWLMNTIKNDWKFYFSKHDYVLEFSNTEDATLFQLRWL